MDNYYKFAQEHLLFLLSVSSTYVGWILLHFIASHSYLQYCVGYGYFDILLSIFYIPTPFCQGLNWLIYNGSKNIMTMWFLFGTYLSNLLLKHLFIPPTEK